MCAIMKRTLVSQQNGASLLLPMGKDHLMESEGLLNAWQLGLVFSVLLNLDKQILTPHQLYEFSSTEIRNINFAFATSEQYTCRNEECILTERFQSASTISGTQKLHSFCPVSQNIMEVRAFSFSPHFREEQVCLHASSKTIPLAAIKGYVTVTYDNHWWLACVMETLPASQDVVVSFLHPHGPSPSFEFPNLPGTLVMHHQDVHVLTVVDPVTETGLVRDQECNYSKTLAQRKLNA